MARGSFVIVVMHLREREREQRKKSRSRNGDGSLLTQFSVRRQENGGEIRKRKMLPTKKEGSGERERERERESFEGRLGFSAVVGYGGLLCTCMYISITTVNIKKKKKKMVVVVMIMGMNSCQWNCFEFLDV